MLANESKRAKSIQITFTMKKDTCPQIKLNNIPIPQANVVKYLGMHLDRRLTWKPHIFNKRKTLGIQFRNMYWLLSRQSHLSLGNKITLYKSVLKPIWTYSIQLWGTAANSNIEIIQRFQSKTLRTMANAPWYITNAQIHRDLNIPSIKHEINQMAKNYQHLILTHPNELAFNLMSPSKIYKRLKRKTSREVSLSLSISK